MRRLTYFIVALAVLYAGYWFIGANRVSTGVETALQQMESDGWTAQAEVATKGFPSRFDTTLSDVIIAGPKGQIRYEAPFVQALALSYRPNNVIVVLPPEQRISGPADAGTLRAERMRASATVKPNLSLAFDDLTIEGTALRYEADSGWNVILEKLLAAARLQADSTNSYDVYAKLDQITLTEQSDPISTILADADIRLQDPLDRNSMEIIVEQVVINAFQITWGDIVLTGQGQLDVDTAGLPVGTIGLQIENWRQLVPALVSAGVMDAGFAQTATTMGGFLAAGQPNITLPLTFEDGFGSLGPLPLGPAPRLHFTR